MSDEKPDTRGTDIARINLGQDLSYPLSRLGRAHAALGDYVAAEQEERRALAIRERSFGPDHPALAKNLSDLARAARRQGRSAEALVLARRAVAIGDKALGVEHPDLADSLVELGITLGRLGRYAEADEQLGRAEAITAKALGPIMSGSWLRSLLAAMS